MSVFRPSVYLRVGPSGSGHTRFINDVAMMCDLKLFAKNSMTPNKMFHRNPTKFEAKIGKCKVQKMVAFDNTLTNHMCSVKSFSSLNGIGLTCSTLKGVDTWIFSVLSSKVIPAKNDSEVDADDVLEYVFGNGELKNRHHTLYENVTEIHHLLGDGRVRILSCEKKKLKSEMVVSYGECLDRVLEVREKREMSMIWEVKTPSM